MTQLEKNFEEWFLSLNADFNREHLSKSVVTLTYFLTTTQALWEQYQRLDKLSRKKIDNFGVSSHSDGSYQIQINGVWLEHHQVMDFLSDGTLPKSTENHGNFADEAIYTRHLPR